EVDTPRPTGDGYAHVVVGFHAVGAWQNVARQSAHPCIGDIQEQLDLAGHAQSILQLREPFDSKEGKRQGFVRHADTGFRQTPESLGRYAYLSPVNRSGSILQGAIAK